HHALEAYKIRDRLAAEGVAVSTWADWWGVKMEGLDGVPENAALVSEAGGRAIIHSDSQSEIRHLNQEAAKAMAAGQRAGVKVGDGTVIERANVVVDNGRIVAVGADVAVPAGAERVDGSNWTITPGFVASDAPDCIVEVGGERQTVDDTVHESVAPAFRAIDV